jgi:AraC-like DNA-binding protein
MVGVPLAMKTVAYDCGFASPDQMRSAFQRRVGVSPLRYRESFRATSLYDARSMHARNFVSSSERNVRSR